MKGKMRNASLAEANLRLVVSVAKNISGVA